MKVCKKILINKVIINIYLLIRLYVTVIFSVFGSQDMTLNLSNYVEFYCSVKKRVRLAYHVPLQSHHPNVDLSLNIRIFILYLEGVKVTQLK